MTTTASFDAETRNQVEAVLDHVNAGHGDTLLFVARHLARSAGVAAPLDAEIVTIDPLGADITVQTGSGPAALRLSFAAPAVTVAEIQQAFIGRLVEAREAAPDEPLTSLERELADTATIPTRLGRLTQRVQLTPNIVEITVSELADLTAFGGDEFSYLVVTDDGSAFPTGWSMDDYRERADDHPIIGAYYTTRRSRPEAGELDIWVVLHDHPTGVAAVLQTAELGTEIAIWGPRQGYEIPADARSVLLVADETGIPAVAALVESAPDTIRLTAVLETVDADHRAPLPDHPLLSVTWVLRGSEPAGHTNRLLDAVSEIAPDAAPDTAFGAAESRHISAVRRHVRNELGLPADRVLMTGYWRRQAD